MKIWGLFDNDKTNEDVSKRQNLIKTIIFISLFTIIILVVFVFDDKKKQPNAGSFNIFQEDKAVKTRWINDVAKDVKIQEGAVQVLQKTVKDIQEENKKLRQELDNQKKEAKSNVATGDGLYKKFPKPEDSELPLDKYFNPEKSEKTTRENTQHNTKTLAPIRHEPIVEQASMQNSLAVENVAVKKIDENATQSVANKDLLSTGSIIRATIINGMDAPTMSQAKDNPLIMHMVVKDLAILPNKNRYDIKECFVLGEGYGDLASERVYIRTNNLSCIAENGEHIDSELKGYVAGEDGKIGLRGTVVSKQGAMLARSVIAGFVDGIAKGFNQVGNTIQVTPFGTTTTSGELQGSELMKKGAYSGLSTGANRLMEFYLKLADQVYPIIEIEAGREVDIVVSNKKEMKTLESGQLMTEKEKNENSK